jgi:hypothetical protein
MVNFAETLSVTVELTRKVAQATHGEVIELKKDVNEFRSNVVNIVKKQADLDYIRNTYRHNPSLRILLAAITNIGLITESNFTTFFNFMVDPSSKTREIYVVIHLGLIALLQSMKPLFGAFELPSNYIHLITTNLSLLGPETHMSDEFYQHARLLFPCQPFKKSLVQDRKKVIVFKMSTLAPYFELAATDENSPFVRSNETCDRAEEILNSMSMTSVQKPSKSKTKRVDKYITQVSVGNKKIYTGLRNMIPLTELPIIVSYMSNNDTTLVDYAKAKHIGIPAGKHFFTPAVQGGIRYFRSLHGIDEDTKKKADVTIGWGCFTDNVPLRSFTTNVYARLETTSHKFKRMMKQAIAKAAVISRSSIPKSKYESKNKKSNVVSGKTVKSRGKALAKRQVESIAKAKAKHPRMLLSEDDESDDTNDYKKTKSKSKRSNKSKAKKSRILTSSDEKSDDEINSDQQITEPESKLQEETSGTEMDNNNADSDNDVDMFGGSGEIDNVTNFMIQQEKKKPLKRKLGPKTRTLPKRQKSNDKV